LADLLPRVEVVDGIEQLRGLEGDAARTYFNIFDTMVRDDREAFRMDGRTRREVERLLHSYQPAPLPGDAKKELVGIMERYAGRHGQDTLPGRTP